MEHTVVVGAGQAGLSLVAKLRNLGYDGQVTLIGDEPVPPYQRPPLSKAYLLGKMEKERLFLRPESFYAENAIDLKLSTAIDRIDPTAKTIDVGGDPIAYSNLVLATGATPRQLPAAMGGALGGVYTIRNLSDVNEMSSAFDAGGHVLVIGGGYIGLEAAAVAAGKGLKVTLIEAGERILQRVAAEESADYLRAVHAAEGVEILEDFGVEELMGNTHVEAARLADGRELPVDFVLVGIGVLPNSQLAEQADLTLDNGIKTDAFGRTSDPSIWAAGDCASFPHNGEQIRIESVGNAVDQAELIAENIMGAEKKYSAKPWFWSDQYDVKLQIAGLNTGYEQVVSRLAEDKAASFWYFKGQELLAIDAFNDPRAYMVGKRLIEAGKSPKVEDVADLSLSVMDFMKR